jgi:single-stranded-DNA-specific exonuclease
MELKNWIFSENENELTNKICSRHKISKILANLLISRNITEEQSIDAFLNDANEFSDPFSFTGMDNLVKRTKKAIENFEKICIFGDYDADGVTATAMMYEYFLSKGADVIYQLPSRHENGYGLSENSIKKIANFGINVIFTVDNGTSSFNEIEFAKKSGIDVIVTDHHKPPEKLPDAAALVNPHLNAGGFADFAGVGVAFKAIEALEYGKKTIADLLNEYGDLLAIGTIADCVPLLGENRELVKLGLKVLENTKKPGLQMFLENCGISEEITSINVSFGISPKINACGRMGTPETAVKLLLSETREEADEFFSVMMEQNEARKIAGNQILEQVNNKISKSGAQFDRVIFSWDDTWNKGVIGIIAANITSKFGKPCFLISVEGRESHASGRSIEGFDMHAATEKCSEFLERFGGHSMAAGLTLKTQNLQKFKSEFLNYVKSAEMPFPSLKIDCVIEPEEIIAENFDAFSPLRPFGTGNPEPVFGIRNVKLLKITPIGGGRHLRLSFSKNGQTFEATLFGVSEQTLFYLPGDVLDLAVYLRRNVFLGSINIAVHINDIKFSSVDTREQVHQKRIFEDFMSNGEIKNAAQFLPDRSEFAVVYRFLKKQSIFSFRVDILHYRLKNIKMNLVKVYIILEVLNELKIIEICRISDNYQISINNLNRKINLNESKILQKIKSQII